MRGKNRQPYRLVPTPEELAIRFLSEAVAATTFAEPFSEQSVALREYLETLQPYRHTDDYCLHAAMPRPWPLPFLIDEAVLYSFFRAWLRKQGTDPDTLSSASIPEPNKPTP